MTLETIFGEFFQISLRPKNHWSISVSNSKSIPFRPCGSPLSSRQSSRQESSPRSSCQLLPPPLPLPLLPLLVALPGNGSKHVAEIETTRPYHTCCDLQNLLLPPDWDWIGQMVIICDKDNLINDDPLDWDCQTNKATIFQASPAPIICSRAFGGRALGQSGFMVESGCILRWSATKFFQFHLVGGFNPLKNMSQIGSSSQLLGKIKNVPNHQTVTWHCCTSEKTMHLNLCSFLHRTRRVSYHSLKPSS